MSNTKRAVAYCRISSDPGDKREGVEDQIEDVTALAAELGASLGPADIYVDNDVPASSSAPLRGAYDTAWRRLQQRIDSDPPNYLLATMYDRLSRNHTDTGWLSGLEKRGVVVWTDAEQNYFADDYWEVRAGIAAAESRRTRRRVLRAKRRRRDRGLNGGGMRRAYGYTPDRLTVVPEEAEVVREMAKRIISGESSSAIAKDLNARGVKTARESSTGWRAETVRDTVRNVRYIGRLTYEGTVIGKAAWPAILTDDEHERAVAALSTTARPSMGRPATSLLGGILRCGGCLTVMNASTMGRGVRAYRCSGVMGGCRRLNRNRDALDEYVTSVMLSTADDDLENPDADALDAEIHELSQREVDLELQLHILHKKYTDGDVSSEDFFPLLDRTRAEHRKTENARKKAMQMYQEMSLASSPAELWKTWTVDQRRAYIRSRVHAIVVARVNRRGQQPEAWLSEDVDFQWKNRTAAEPPPACQRCGEPVGIPRRYWMDGVPPHLCDDCSEEVG